MDYDILEVYTLSKTLQEMFSNVETTMDNFLLHCALTVGYLA